MIIVVFEIAWIKPCPQCSWDTVWIHHLLDRDIVLTEDA